jgi:acetolactate synthase-1/2/3 large subunit
MWTAQYYPLNKPRSLITSGGLGAMGFGLGAAIGAKAAAPERTVVLVTGDGSFHMNCIELATAVHFDLPLVIVIMNNGVLGMVRQWQELLCHERYTATTLNRGTDFVMAAQAFGCIGLRAETMTEAEESLRKAFASGHTCVVDCRISENEKAYMR